jgi:hypothetical protein
MKRLFCLTILLAAVLVVPTTQAEAISITPATTAVTTGNETSQAAIDLIIAAFIAGSDELYKMEVEGLVEIGDLAGSYDTEFFNSPDDPEDATIEYVGGPIVSPTAFLLVKDGNSTPAWYLFNLTSLGWDGMETLTLTDFWVGRGAISHVTLYGGTTTVPEPATLSMVALGLFGVGAVRRRLRVA